MINNSNFKGDDTKANLKQLHNTDIKQWDIVEIDFGRNSGSVQSGKRPAIVVSNNINNMHSPNITVIPMTTKTKTILPTHIYINDELAEKLGIDSASTILCEQIQTVSKDAICFNKGNNVTFARLKIAIASKFFIQIFGTGIVSKLTESFIYSLIELAPKFKSKL